jgi:hypothetical protein
MRSILGMVAGLLVMMAVAGASSATATTLCREATSPCPAELRYEKGTEVAAEGNSTLESTFATIKCSTAAIMIKIKAESGKPLPAEVNTAEWEGCQDQNSNACKVKATGVAWNASLEWTSGFSAKLALENPGFEFTCGKETCIYGAAKETGIFVGAEVFKIEIGATTFERQAGSGLSCSTTDKLAPLAMSGTTGYYGLTNPVKVYPSL